MSAANKRAVSRMEDIYIAKLRWRVVCCNEHGKVVKKKMLKRADVLKFFHTMPACLVVLEACATAHYWLRDI